MIELFPAELHFSVPTNNSHYTWKAGSIDVLLKNSLKTHLLSAHFDLSWLHHLGTQTTVLLIVIPVIVAPHDPKLLTSNVCLIKTFTCYPILSDVYADLQSVQRGCSKLFCPSPNLSVSSL